MKLTAGDRGMRGFILFSLLQVFKYPSLNYGISMAFFVSREGAKGAKERLNFAVYPFFSRGPASAIFTPR